MDSLTSLWVYGADAVVCWAMFFWKDHNGEVNRNALRVAAGAVAFVLIMALAAGISGDWARVVDYVGILLACSVFADAAAIASRLTPADKPTIPCIMGLAGIGIVVVTSVLDMVIS